MKAELHLILFTTSVTSTKVFFFNSTDDSEQPSSAAILLESPQQPLPEKFSVCFAMKQDKIDGRSPFLIRDKNDQPWIAFSVWHHSGVLGLWGEIGQRDWKMFHVFEKPWKFWSHICTDIDTLVGVMSVSIDGRPPVTKTFERLKDGRPIRLEKKLEIGVTETEMAYGGRRLFRGEVSMIQFYSFDRVMSAEVSSQNPCQTEGTYLAWSDMTFDRIGESVHELERYEEEICEVLPDFYNALLPGMNTWIQANYLCKVLGGGSMAGVEDEKDIERLVSRVENIPVGSCPMIWLPLSDERKEGFWENTNSNSESKFLKWSAEQPNGLRNQNHAALSMEHFHFGDFHAEATHCASCKLRTKVTQWNIWSSFGQKHI